MKPGVSAVQPGATKGHSAHLQQAAVALDLLKVEDLSALQVGRSADLPGAVALLAQTAMGAAVRSDAAAEGVALEASLAAIRPEVFPAVAPLGASPVAVSQVATVGEAVMVEGAEAVDKSW